MGAGGPDGGAVAGPMRVGGPAGSDGVVRAPLKSLPAAAVPVVT
jgi:hypothetical protein